MEETQESRRMSLGPGPLCGWSYGPVTPVCDVSHWAAHWGCGAESPGQGLTGLTFWWMTPLETSPQGHFR